MNKSHLGIKFLLGPSHLIRWRKQILDNSIDSNLSENQLFGIAGVPVWSKILLEKTCNLATNNKVGLMVGDFRFGNSIYGYKNQSSVFANGFTKIHSEFCSDEIDKKIFNRALNAIKYFHQKNGNNIIFIFWCLFCREVQNRLQKKHWSSTGYKHPTWNYKDVINSLPGFDIADLSPLLKLPMHEVNRLFIDSSGHPSAIGYFFLEKVLFDGYDTITAYKFAVEKFENIFLNYAREIKKFSKFAILSGDSIWVNTFSRVLGMNGQSKLAKEGIFIGPIKKMQGRNNIHDIKNVISEDILKISTLYLVNDFLKIEEINLQGLAINTSNLVYIDWDGPANKILINRGLKSLRSGNGIYYNKPLITPLVTDSMVELGGTASPTIEGLKTVINLAQKNLVN